jgi:aryl-alcohol dehydrogenase-like predicted oxidoreductase
MERMKLGRTGLVVGRSGFGALPIQRLDFEEAGRLLVKAYDNGIDFFDTARAYSDSEEKIGRFLSDVRRNIVIATKTFAKDGRDLFKQLETSLKNLRTDYIDIYQLHNPEKLPDPEDRGGLYTALLEARKKGMIRFIGLTNHRLDIALEAISSGLYDTLQFPLSSLSADEDLRLVEACRESDTGLIAMKALSGGLITNAAPTFAFLRQFDNVLPIWGIQRESELDEFLSFERNPPALDEEMLRLIRQDREELKDSFCRGCGYCMPCPAGIPINTAARMSFLLRRAPYQGFLSDEWRGRMELINGCINCGQCKKRCPYKLDTPVLLRRMLEDYREFYRSHKS